MTWASPGAFRHRAAKGYSLPSCTVLELNGPGNELSVISIVGGSQHPLSCIHQNNDMCLRGVHFNLLALQHIKSAHQSGAISKRNLKAGPLGTAML